MCKNEKTNNKKEHYNNYETETNEARHVESAHTIK